MATGDLTTLAAVKEQMETSATAADSLIETLIASASRTICRWTGREFAAVGANPQTRLIEVGGYGALAWAGGVPVGDMAATPTAVSFIDAAGAIVETLVVADHVLGLPVSRPDGRPITHLRLRPASPTPTSDVVLSVTGVFGWPSVPLDVEQAAIVTVRGWLRQAPVDPSSDFDEFSGRSLSVMPSGGWMLPMAAKQRLSSYRPRMGLH